MNITLLIEVFDWLCLRLLLAGLVALSWIVLHDCFCPICNAPPNADFRSRLRAARLRRAEERAARRRRARRQSVDRNANVRRHAHPAPIAQTFAQRPTRPENALQASAEADWRI